MSLFNIQNTYPGVKGRKKKKAFKKKLTYDALNLKPFSFNKQRTSHINSPIRGELVFNRSGMLGKFVGVDPTGKVWVALKNYDLQFPYSKQIEVFDNCWRNEICYV